MIRALIIEDEDKSRKLLENLLRTYCHNVEVVGAADSVKSGKELINQEQPDLVFLDIILKNKSGFDLLEQIDPIHFEVIFTTAHQEYAIKAIRVSALDYLTKPLNVDELVQAVQKVEEKISEQHDRAVLNQPLMNFIENQRSINPENHKISIPTCEGFSFIPIREIIFCKAEGNYTEIFLENNKLVVTRTLKEFDELLGDYRFFRVHRSFLINLQHLRNYSRVNQLADMEGDGGCVTLTKNIQVPVSRDKRKDLLKFLSKPF